MFMHDFEYVPKKEWKPIRDELLEIIRRLQNEVRDSFTFQYHFVGSSSRNMITRDRNSNTGFDFDVNIEVNDPHEDYSAEEIRNILRKGLDKVTNPYGYPIFRIERTLVFCIVATFALYMNAAISANNIFATTKNKTVIRGNTNRKGIWSCHPKLSGLKSTDCGNRSERIT